ncbi:MAG: hypothetical protein ACRDK9_02040, partial [Solirubrobacterales bacterium]
LPDFIPPPVVVDAEARHRRDGIGRVGIYLATGGEFLVAAVTRGPRKRVLGSLSGWAGTMPRGPNMDSMAQNGKIKRFSRKELEAMTRPAQAMTPAQKRAAVDRATRGLRVGVQVTEGLYRRR